MSDHKGLFQKILDVFLNIFTSAAKELWNSLTHEEQGALKQGSGVMKIINDHIDESPEEIKAIIGPKTADDL